SRSRTSGTACSRPDRARCSARTASTCSTSLPRPRCCRRSFARTPTRGPSPTRRASRPPCTRRSPRFWDRTPPRRSTSRSRRPCRAPRCRAPRPCSCGSAGTSRRRPSVSCGAHASATRRRASFGSNPALATAGAEADDLDAVVGGDEAVALRRGRDPVVEAALLHLHHAVAALAEQVMMMLVPAEPVALLASVVGEDVDDAVLAQERQRAIHGGEARAGVALAEPAPQLLGRHVVALAGELLEHLEAPRRRPHPV